MISKQTFINTVEAIKKQKEKERDFSEALDKIVDGRFVSQISVDIESALVKILEEIFHDTQGQDGDGWISWWLYEKDLGERIDLRAYYGEADGGKEIKLRDAGELYDFLIKNIEDNKKTK